MVRLKEMLHSVCRNGFYPRTQNKILRFEVPDAKVLWKELFPEYLPTPYTADHILQQPSYADPQIGSTGFTPKWNSLDGNVNRKSHDGDYEIVDGVPRNPRGRTGVCGRGCLGRWGPNHAADPIVTRWKYLNNCQQIGESGKPILQFVAIQRRDNNQWAIPGGMVDAGEKISSTLRREFMEEALNCLTMNHQEKLQLEQKVLNFFSQGTAVYSGYVDDPRNTDNAWMESEAHNFHDEKDDILANLELSAGDDAKNVTWMDISDSLNLHANHKAFLHQVAYHKGAHW